MHITTRQNWNSGYFGWLRTNFSPFATSRFILNFITCSELLTQILTSASAYAFIMGQMSPSSMTDSDWNIFLASFR